MNKLLRRKLYRVLTAFLAVFLLASVLTVPAFAEPDDTATPAEAETQAATTAVPVVEPPVTEAPETTAATEPPTTEPATEPTADILTEPEPVTEAPAVPETEGRSMFRFTPDGSLTLVDDFEYVGMDADGNLLSKQFITVQSRDGSYFYIIIDRTGDGENVYFLNQVDLADLKSLANNEKQTIPDTGCTCTTHCTVGHIDTTCPVCAVNMSECAVIDVPANDSVNPDPSGDDSQPTDTGNPGKPDEPTRKQTMNPILAMALTVIALGGIIFYLFKGKGKKGGSGKRRKKQPEYDFDDEEDNDEDEELEAEPAPEERDSAPSEHLTPATPPIAPSAEDYSEEDYDFEDDSDLM